MNIFNKLKSLFSRGDVVTTKKVYVSLYCNNLTLEGVKILLKNKNIDYKLITDTSNGYECISIDTTNKSIECISKLIDIDIPISNLNELILIKG